MSHTTHFDDCGCLTARYEARIAELEQREREFDKLHAVQVARVEILIGEKATLEAELSGVRQASATELAHAYAHAKTLRDALAIIHDGHGGGAAFIAGEALAQTPAATLAAHRKSVLEEAAIICESRDCRGCADNIRNPSPHGIPRALAAQAQAATHSELEVKP